MTGHWRHSSWCVKVKGGRIKRECVKGRCISDLTVLGICAVLFLFAPLDMAAAKGPQGKAQRQDRSLRAAAPANPAAAPANIDKPAVDKPSSTKTPRMQTAPAAGSTEQAKAKLPQAGARSSASGNLVGHGGPIKALSIEPGGRYVLTGSFDYSMMLWDISKMPPRQSIRFDGHEGAVNAVAFVPGGKLVLAAGDDASVWLWQRASGKLRHRFKGHKAKINHLSVSMDGRYVVSSSWDRTARIWDLKELQPGPVLKGHKGPVNAAVFSADGRHVYTAGYDGDIRLWDRASGKFLRIVYKHGWGINVLQRLPGGEQLLWGALNGAAGVVDGRSGKIIAKLPGHDRPVLSLAAIAKPGLIATGGGDGVIRVMRIGDWAVTEEYQNSFGPIWALDFVPGGKVMYYGGLDDFATRWQVSPRKPFEPVASKFPRRFQVSKEVSAGERQFARKCSVCHTVEKAGRNRAGPTLYRIFGRKAGSLDGYPYSAALKNANIIWNDDTIGKLFALGPEHFTPGSKMPLQKISDAQTRADLLGYLKIATAPGRRGGETREVGKTKGSGKTNNDGTAQPMGR